MAQAARFSIWKRGFESRWGRRADLLTCGLLRGATPRRSSLPIRTALFSLSRRPGIGLRTRLARFDSSQRGQHLSAAFSRAAPCPCSRGTRHKPPKLVAQVRFLAGAPQGGTVPPGVHTPGPAGSIPAPASRGASRRAAALIRLSVEVRLLPSRSPFLGVAQPGRAPVPGTGYWGFESLHPDQFSSGIFLWMWLNGRAPVLGTGDWRFESSHSDRHNRRFSGCGSIW